MIDKILKEYYSMKRDYHSKIYYEEEYKPMQVVIIISPKAYYKLIAEAYKEIFYINIDNINNISFILLSGNKTPIIVEDNLPKDVDFIIQYKEDYERLEKEKLLNKLANMFNQQEV